MDNKLLTEPERILTKDDEELRIGTSEFKGRMYIVVRKWFQVKHGEWIPTKKGVVFNSENLPEVAKALNDLNHLLWPETE
jgi:hypothetical protein